MSNSYTYPTTASNVHAYVVDTGIRLTHHDFGGRAVSGRDTVHNGDHAGDCHGHGTHVAGTLGGSAYGVAKGVQLVAVRVMDCQGSGSTATVVAGVDWLTANAIKPAVANMSLGGGPHSVLDTAIRNSINSGIGYVVAAGNEHTNACSRLLQLRQLPGPCSPPARTSSRPGTPATAPRPASAVRQWPRLTSPAPPRCSWPTTPARRPRRSATTPRHDRHDRPGDQPGSRLALPPALRAGVGGGVRPDAAGR